MDERWTILEGHLNRYLIRSGLLPGDLNGTCSKGTAQRIALSDWLIFPLKYLFSVRMSRASSRDYPQLIKVQAHCSSRARDHELASTGKAFAIIAIAIVERPLACKLVAHVILKSTHIQFQWPIQVSPC